MDGYEVVIAELGTAAGGARSVADGTRSLTPGTAVTAGAAGIPGADSVAAITQVSTRWEQAVTGWATQVRAYGDNLDTAADNYRGDENVVSALFSYLAGMI